MKAKKQVTQSKLARKAEIARKSSKEAEVECNVAELFEKAARYLRGNPGEGCCFAMWHVATRNEEKLVPDAKKFFRELYGNDSDGILGYYWELPSHRNNPDREARLIALHLAADVVKTGL